MRLGLYMIRVIAIGVLVITVGILTFSISTISYCEEDVYNKFVTIEGNVRITEPETGKVFTPTNQNLIFQRMDCKKCLYLAITDENGYYKLRVGQGRYRLIVKEDLSRGGSSLDPGQSDVVDAQNKVSRTIFDVKLVRHKNEIELPKNIVVPSSLP
jgi:hypothetical protein